MREVAGHRTAGSQNCAGGAGQHRDARDAAQLVEGVDHCRTEAGLPAAASPSETVKAVTKIAPSPAAATLRPPTSTAVLSKIAGSA